MHVSIVSSGLVGSFSYLCAGMKRNLRPYSCWAKDFTSELHPSLVVYFEKDSFTVGKQQEGHSIHRTSRGCKVVTFDLCLLDS